MSLTFTPPTRSGELFPYGIVPNGTLAGILDGERPPIVDVELASGLRRIVPVGVFVPDLEGPP